MARFIHFPIGPNLRHARRSALKPHFATRCESKQRHWATVSVVSTPAVGLASRCLDNESRQIRVGDSRLLMFTHLFDPSRDTAGSYPTIVSAVMYAVISAVDGAGRREAYAITAAEGAYPDTLFAVVRIDPTAYASAEEFPRRAGTWSE